MTTPDADTLPHLIAERADAQHAFLAELVKVPSDNPPGDCAPHAARAAELLEGCLLYTSPSPRDLSTSRMPSSA